MATKKIRVYELARELGVENAVVLDLANELKIGVKSHSSSIDDPSADRVRRLADAEGLRGEPIVDEPEPPKPEKRAAPRTRPRRGARRRPRADRARADARTRRARARGLHRGRARWCRPRRAGRAV